MANVAGKINYWLEAEIKYRVQCLNADSLGLPAPTPPTQEELLNSRPIGQKEVMHMTGLGRGHINWLISKGTFPAAFKQPSTVKQSNEGENPK